MKNILYLIIISPVALTVFFIIAVFKIDSTLTYVTGKPIGIELEATNFNSYEDLHNPPKMISYVFADNSASRHRIYFFISNDPSDHKKYSLISIEKDPTKIKYYRAYRGFITGWSKFLEGKKLEKASSLSFYVDNSKINKSSEPIAFFGLNNPRKGFSYYVDIYQYFKDRYIFVFWGFVMAYMFLGGWAVDNFASAKAPLIIFLIELIYMGLILVW